ncbi:hypothetical protein GU926_12285 [Nibribacter ruber]|uniref:Putative auto-transporter adhesin head GIN domain-containing protein n=1 Tax=Nibribacter ruber TaxID=2698458 RepID=A0A6P1P0H3_9BACT|nr:head GIN domain-containing protein [Nibribacter ruber]QHL88169.1 hypothetical protein GU926_12285 [Nibribacter ruber]
MKRHSLLTALLLLIVASALASFTFSATALLDQEDRSIGAFTMIGLAFPAHVEVRKGSTHSVKVEGDAKDLKELITEVKDGKLLIKRKDSDNWISWGSNDSKPVRVYVTTPTLEAVSVSGSGKLVAQDTFKGASMSLAVSGSGSITMSTDVDKLTSKISGSGTIHLKGEGKSTSASISGSGSLKGYDFETETASVSISGSGSCEINAKATLKSIISGSGRVYYSGSPSVDSRVSGSGSVKRRG